MNLAAPFKITLIFSVYITSYNVCLILNSHFCNKDFLKPTYVKKERIKTTTMGQRDEIVM